METLQGRVLCEADIHSGDNGCLERVGTAIAGMHRLAIPASCSRDPVLWHRMSMLLTQAALRPESWPQDVPRSELICQELNKTQIAMELRDFPVVPCHGDLKPSSIFLSETGESPLLATLTSDLWKRIFEFSGDDVYLVDCKAFGPNYRGFDLMKFLRAAPDIASPESMRHFLRVYRRCMGYKESEESVAKLMEEIALFECLIWLEEMCMYLVLPQIRPADSLRWNAMAAHCWEKYAATKEALVGDAAWRKCLAILG